MELMAKTKINKNKKISQDKSKNNKKISIA
jgi:hypothetical protein